MSPSSTINIYADTNIWNALCDQTVDPERLAASLAAKGSRLVLSYHTVFELLKTFRGSGEQTRQRAAKLFSFLRDYLSLNRVMCVHEILEVLGFEMSALVGRIPAPNPFVPKEALGEMISEVNRLAAGEFSPQAESFVNERVSLSSAARSGQKDHSAKRVDMTRKLRSIAPDRLETWLDASTAQATPEGIALLSDKIRYRFKEASDWDSLQYANALMNSPTLRSGKALVRADLYYNWRCANRGSNPKDLFDDMYHVLGAIYCDCYVTKEPAQAEYAHLLLTRATRVRIYKAETPINTWLESVAAERPSLAA